jgi:hypothetical protein
MNPGVYKAQEDCLLLIWPQEWPKEFAEKYKLALDGVGKMTHDGTFPVQMPIGYKVKAGQELTLEWGARRKLNMPPVGEQLLVIYVIDVTVKVGSKVYTGITMAYNDSFPSIVSRAHSIRPVKKRK